MNDIPQIAEGRCNEMPRIPDPKDRPKQIGSSELAAQELYPS